MSQHVCAIVGAGEGLGRALASKFATQGHASTDDYITRISDLLAH